MNIVDSRFSRAAFEEAGLSGMETLLGELQTIIQKETDKITASSKSSQEKSEELNRLWESICERLNHLGHHIYSHDYDGDIRWEHNSQVWGQDYMKDTQNGLSIVFESHAIAVSWVIHRKTS